MNDADRTPPAEARLIERGASIGRCHDLKVVATSRCAFEVSSEKHADTCEAVLLQFEAYLRKRSLEDTKYEWANIVRSASSFSFDIHWYDERFFDERKNAFLVGAHAFALQRFGLTPHDLVVSHQALRHTA